MLIPSDKRTLATLLAGLVVLTGCTRNQTGSTSEPSSTATTTSATSASPGAGETTDSSRPGQQDLFVERAEASGLRFVHFNGMSGEFYFPETIPAGVGLLDYDNDGDLDVYLVQGQMLGEGKTLSQALFNWWVRRRSKVACRNDLEVRTDGPAR